MYIARGGYRVSEKGAHLCAPKISLAAGNIRAMIERAAEIMPFFRQNRAFAYFQPKNENIRHLKEQIFNSNIIKF